MFCYLVAASVCSLLFILLFLLATYSINPPKGKQTNKQKTTIHYQQLKKNPHLISEQNVLELNRKPSRPSWVTIGFHPSEGGLDGKVRTPSSCWGHVPHSDGGPAPMVRGRANDFVVILCVLHLIGYSGLLGRVTVDLEQSLVRKETLKWEQRDKVWSLWARLPPT